MSLQEDYLDEDKVIKGQNFVCLSFLTPLSFPEDKREQYKNQKILGLKVRGVYKTYEEADERAKYLQKVDKYHHVFVGEVGKWLPFNVDTADNNVDNQVYREQELNQYMKAYKDSLNEEEKAEAERKEGLLQGANVVTGKHDAPEITGLGTGQLESFKMPEPIRVNTEKVVLEEGVPLEEQLDKLEAQQKLSKEEAELSEVRQQKVEITNNLESSKSTLKELEQKMETISQIYNKLHNKL
jgi:hypothetical protein